MSILVKPTTALKPRTVQSGQMSLLFAGLLTVMAVAQLFTFEHFVVLLEDLSLPLGIPSLLVASLVVIAEVFALPFLLRMDLSIAFRWLSMFLGWFVVVFWLLLSCWVWFSVPLVESAGFLGTVPLPPGPWMILLSVSMAILAIWSAWGLWPGRRAK